MHLSILIETMRREGYEFQVSTPKVLTKTENGQLMEPMEELVIDVPEEYMGSVMEKMGQRKGELTHMTPQGSRMRIEFKIPSRGLFGYRSQFMTDTKGEGILNTIFAGYEPHKGDIPRRNYGSLIAFETGESITYGLYNAQERGELFIGAGVPVYEGMVVGRSPKADDIAVNVCKKKQSDQHPCLRLGRRAAPGSAQAHEPGGIARIYRGGRTARDYSGEHPHPQANSQ